MAKNVTPKPKKTRTSTTTQKKNEAPKRYETIKAIGGISLLILASYTLISLLSYAFTWSSDQSLLSGENLSKANIANIGGVLGFKWSNLLISKYFGFGAYLFPIFIALYGLYLINIYKKISLAKLSYSAIYGIIIISILSSFIFSFTNCDSLFGTDAGGEYGYYITQWLRQMVGRIGIASIILISSTIWLAVMSKSFITRFNKWVEKSRNLKFPKKIEGDEKIGDRDENIEEIDSTNTSNIEESDNTEEEDIKDINSNIEEDNNQEEDNSIYKIRDITDQVAETFNENADNENSLEILSVPEAPVHSPSGDTQLVDFSTQEDSNEITTNEVHFEDGESLSGKYTEEELKTLFDPRLDLSKYQAPPLSLLEDYSNLWYEVSKEELEKNKIQIEKTLLDYKIGIIKISARIGPTVTLYEIVPAPGVRVAQIKRLEEDIQLSLAAKGVRVVTLLGTNAIGIEVANEKPSTISMLSVLDDQKFKNAKYDLPIALGKTITNDVMHFDLAKMPHLLVAGATGQGKSVGLNAILASLLYRKHPSEMKLVLVDPKKVELSLYSKLEKHFLAQLPDADEPVITDTQKVVYTLKSLCMEMDTRYDLLKMASVRHVKEYNEKFLQRRLNPLKGHKFMPYIVVVIDEFADLLMTAGKEIEEPIARLAQLARAIGIHLVIATQRPTTSVITGNIKANFPARIAFMVRSSIDSRTILDQTGANQLIGRGDMLISTGGDLVRVQCAFIDTKEVDRIVDFIGDQRGYSTPYYLPEYTGEEREDDGGGVGSVDLNKRDALFEDAAKLIVMHQQGSTSLIQRKMNLGYNRAGRIIDQLEVAGVVGPFEGSKSRQVLVSDLTELDAKLAYIKDIYG